MIVDWHGNNGISVLRTEGLSDLGAPLLPALQLYASRCGCICNCPATKSNPWHDVANRPIHSIKPRETNIDQTYLLGS